MTAGVALVVLDYSGTLSVAAPTFDVAGALRETGLSDLGIDTDVFWQHIVGPTWEHASTTATGYAGALADAAVAVLRGRDVEVDAAEVHARLAAFRDRYFAHATLAPEWHPFLRRLAGRPGTRVVVATDHYAEATGHIVAELADAGVPAVPIGGVRGGGGAGGGVRGGGGGGGSAVVVANSADIGAHKATPAFWRAVRDALGDPPVDRVVLVDDFGANETSADVYADADRVRRRRDATAGALCTVFGRSPHIVPFVLTPATDVAAAVDAAGRSTMTVLSDGS